MSLSLKDFTSYQNIVIQCHNTPDADALASGFALQMYFKKQGMNVPFVYGGKDAVSKANLVKMIQTLNIHVKHVQEIPKPELLITVDCQYGESNVAHFDAEKVAIIDHHQVFGELPPFSDIRSNYGSCSTILYEMLEEEGLDINDDFTEETGQKTALATALYYGLLTDTGGATEISHPADLDLFECAEFDPDEIAAFRYSNYSKEELYIAADALKDAAYNEEYSCGIIASKPCDSNILGLVSDMFLEVDSIGACLVYCLLKDGVKFSVRSCVKEVKASELASFLAEGIGGGGGHLIKAGGFMRKELMLKNNISFDDDSVESYFKEKLDEYFKETEIIHAGEHTESVSDLAFYRKVPVKVGYAESVRLAPAGSKITVRTLEGDVDIDVSPDHYIILGVDGEIYPCSRKKFESNYRVLEEDYVYPGEYPPTVIRTLTNDRIGLLPFAKSCLATGGDGIYARELDHRVKVFTKWDPSKYYLGKKGDYLAVRVDDLSDVYVIARNIFEKTYVKEEQ